LQSCAYFSHAFGILIKGKPVVLVEDGRLQRKNMRLNHISEHDLEEDMRLDAATEDLSKITVARIERSGDISFIKGDYLLLLHRRRSPLGMTAEVSKIQDYAIIGNGRSAALISKCGSNRLALLVAI
jgi:uncharacterized membrane protein YcaP (DUF421 family)